MRKLALLLMFVSVVSKAGVLYSFKVTGTGGATIPAAYSLSDVKSRVLTGMTKAKYATELCVYNGTAAVIAMNLDAGDATVAPTVDVNDIYIPASMGYCMKTTDKSLTSKLLIRSDSGAALTAGTVYGSITR